MNKKLYIFGIPFLALSLLTVVSCSGDVKLNQQWYAIGYGSFVNGSNWTIDSGIQLDKVETDEYKELFVANEVSFLAGDTFVITNENQSITLQKNHYSLESNSFSSQNVFLYSLGDDVQVDIIKSGNYNISLALKSSTYILNVTNGTGTTPYDPLDKPSGATTIDFFGNGDHHGVVIDTVDGNLHYPAIEKYIGYLKSLTDSTPNEDIIISNGDLWQGTLQSNANMGAMLNDILESAGYASFTLGNHEFDWGQEIIQNNSAESSVPFLGANIVKKDDGRLVDYVQPYTIVEKSGLRVGIIGTVGASQIQDILSTNVDDINFGDEIEAVKTNSDRLRDEFDCDIIIASFHDGTSSIEGEVRSVLSLNSPVSGKRYVDGVFTAHDHTFASKIVNSVPILNSGNNGKYIANFSLKYDDGNVSCPSRQVFSNSDSSVSNIYAFGGSDTETKAIVDEYYTDELIEKATSVAGVLDASFSKTLEAPNMMAKAMYEYAHDEGHNVVLAMVNQGRSNLPMGDVTYTDLFSAFPFTNKTVIMNVKGSDLRLASGNYAYSANPFTFQDNSTYLIAVYDYLAYHQNAYREYDYFLNRDVVTSLGKFPVDLIYDYMKEQTGIIHAADYSGDNFTFLKNQ